MSTGSNSDNNNMLDKGLSTNICESMKARLVPNAPHSGSSPPSLSCSPPSTDPENNLNKGGGEKGMYSEKPVLNIDYQNYTLKTPSSAPYSSRGSPNISTSPEQVLVNVTSPQEQLLFSTSCTPTDIRLSALTCTCSSSSVPPAVKHKLSSLLPLLECRACFHNECAPFNRPCKRVLPHALPPTTLGSRDVPVADWSAGLVVEWMAALNLSSYTELFKSQDIKGADLISLDKEKLGNMGIKDEFHQESILVRIGELQNTVVDSGGGGAGGTVGGGGDCKLECSTPASMHSLRPHSFSQLHTCDKCGHYLRGFIHQGQYCQDCDLIVHRSCASTGLPLCVRQSSKCMQQRSLLSSVFGLSLCNQVCSRDTLAPILLVRLCNELVARARANPALDLYRLYRTNPSQEALDKLRADCDHAYPDIYNLDLSGYEAHTIAFLVKRFLQELPEPVLPELCYDRFVDAARAPATDDERLKYITSLLATLTQHHYDTLKFLMLHFLQLCHLQVARGNKDPPTILLRSLCHVLMRPPWDKIIELAHNTDAHMRIMEVLLLRVDWGEMVPSFSPTTTVPPRPSHPTEGLSPASPLQQPLYAGTSAPLPPPSPTPTLTATVSGHDQQPRCLREAEWYWGGVSRDQVNVLMKDARDGTFLVRDASTGNNEYTLTLRKGGSNKLIKIFHSNGAYGFTEPYTFSSVVELVNYCCQQSLSKFNKTLDIRLLYPISKKYSMCKENDLSNIEEIKTKLYEMNREGKAKAILHEQKVASLDALSSLLQAGRQGLDAYEDALAWLGGHSGKQAAVIADAAKQPPPHELNELKANHEVVVGRQQMVLLAHATHQARLQDEWEKYRALERQVYSLKADQNIITNKRTELINVLLSKGIAPDKLDQETEQVQSSCSDYSESSWLLESCTREEAAQLLAGKPDGTFLVRTRQPGSYALSISCGNEVQHCLIYKSDSGFGFAEPYLKYGSLKELVIHYSRNSLLIHNDLLNTTLNYPVNATS